MKPILFNTDMVRAILDGRKRVTRRVVKPQHLRVLDSPYHKEHPEMPDKTLIEKLCEPPCGPGDILYVRETWNYGYVETSDAEDSHEAWFEEGDWRKRGEDSFIDCISRFFYRADENDFSDIGMTWRPSIHMPREAACIVLRVTNVRAERLQDMTLQDSLDEGVGLSLAGSATGNKAEAMLPFILTWNSTVKPADRDRFGWDANPWVWVIEFERCEKPKEGGET